MTARLEAGVPDAPRERALARARRVVVGRPLATDEELDERLPKVKALSTFASDNLSSVAYATELIMFTLLAAGTAAFWLVMPISILIVSIFAIIVVSYRQTIRAYPSGGGSYIVARENLGTGPSLLAAAALLTDYVLTVSVSVAAGVLAITSAFPELTPLRVPLGVVAILFVMIINLRGLRESGTAFAAPTYVFLVVTLGLIAIGHRPDAARDAASRHRRDACGRAGRVARAAPADAGVRRRLQRDHRRRGGFEWRTRLQADRVAQCPDRP